MIEQRHKFLFAGGGIVSFFSRTNDILLIFVTEHRVFLFFPVVEYQVWPRVGDMKRHSLKNSLCNRVCLSYK